MGTAVVTGASSGLGRELALLLASRGEHVVAVARSAEALSALAGSSPRIEAVVADLATPQGRDELARAVDVVDILVNNAGLGSSGRFADAPRAVSDRMVEVNVAALTDLTARWLPGMVARGAGRVVNVASTAAFQPGPKMAVYYATKAYVLSFTEAIAEELRRHRCHRDRVLPGTVRERLPVGRGHRVVAPGSRAAGSRRRPTWRARRSRRWTAAWSSPCRARSTRRAPSRRGSCRASLVRRMVARVQSDF